ncbi:MAG: SAM-dependent methyltransferase [Betaproteobacteria bacterium]|nr:SAM-dependent methyltransferase [Betaproteobacteria bacterium]
MTGQEISDRDFEVLRALLHREAGIALSPQKKPMVCGRLGRRLEKLRLNGYSEYLSRIDGGGDPAELQVAIDLLTTNETYFFREPKHFDWLRERVRQLPRGRGARVWSAACSSGEEPYTIAMVLADTLGSGPWEVVASGLSTRVLARAREGLYPMQRAEHIPRGYLARYCRRGTGPYDGTFLVDRALRERVTFRQVNLLEPPPGIGPFDVIFLRNVMIYFDTATKREVSERLAGYLQPDGYLVIGHSESLNGVTDALHAEHPTIYRRAPKGAS